MRRYSLESGAALVLQRGDITAVDDDAIVNAANSWMLGGGGVDGAIHRAAGWRLKEACRQLPVVGDVRCPPGEARITPGFELPARFVIHAVGPRYHPGRADLCAAQLAGAYASSLDLARAEGLRSVAFPAISCGAYRYPLDGAAAIALEAVNAGSAGIGVVRFVHFVQETMTAWEAAAERLGLAAE
jgi:O-acetyl-ADP-ribose deacetylase (regulator of RNase III)